MLTQKQEAFCLAYLTEPDAAKAYRKAYASQRMKDSTIWEAASRMLASSKVSARIAELRKAAADQAVISEAEILRELRRLALSDPAAMFDPATGDLWPIDKMPAHVRACIASIEIDDRSESTHEGPRPYRVKKVKVWDKNAAIDKAMKHLGSFERDNKQKAGLFDDYTPEQRREALMRMRAAVAKMKEPA